MANWDERYFITELKQTNVVEAPWAPVFTDKEAMRLLAMDSQVIKGAFHLSLGWFWPGKWPATKGEEGTINSHSHPFDEVIVFVGTNPDDPYDLGGEVELWIDGKQNILDKSFIAFVPAGTMHCPLRILRVDKPILHFSSGMGQNYNPENPMPQIKEYPSTAL